MLLPGPPVRYAAGEEGLPLDNPNQNTYAIRGRPGIVGEEEWQDKLQEQFRLFRSKDRTFAHDRWQVPDHGDPRRPWRTMALDQEYRAMANLVLRTLSVPSGSAGVERTVSGLRRVHTWERNRLAPSRVDRLVFAHENLRLVRDVVTAPPASQWTATKEKMRNGRWRGAKRGAQREQEGEGGRRGEEAGEGQEGREEREEEKKEKAKNWCAVAQGRMLQTSNFPCAMATLLPSSVVISFSDWVWWAWG